MATTEAVDILRSIDGSLKQLVKLLSKTAPAEIADDRDLDSKWGNPEVKFTPRDWTGLNMKGRRMSECPAEFLDLLAQTFDYFAKKAEDTDEQYNGKPVAPYKRRDAARARGWAKRARDGKAPVPAGAKEDVIDPAWDAESEWPEV
jgi:hypothetical protein